MEDKNKESLAKVAYKEVNRYAEIKGYKHELKQKVYNCDDFIQDAVTEVFYKIGKFDPKKGTFEEFCKLCAIGTDKMLQLGLNDRTYVKLNSDATDEIKIYAGVVPYKLLIELEKQMPEGFNSSVYGIKSAIGYSFSELTQLTPDTNPEDIKEILNDDKENIINFMLRSKTNNSELGKR